MRGRGSTLLLSFSSRELRTLCEEPPASWPKAGHDHLATIDRLADMLAADTLAEMPIGVCWNGIRPDRVIIAVSDTCRLVCRSNHVEVRYSPDGEPEWSTTTRLYVVSVEVDGRTS